MTLLTAADLTKRYPGSPVDALHGVSLSVDSAQLVALVGHNGAGKSTLVDLLCQLTRPTSGSVETSLGRSDIGWCPQREVVDWSLTVRQNIDLVARLSPRSRRKSRVEGIGALMGLEKYFDREVETISGGELRRTMIARALVNQPKLALLDEPTTGLDPDGTKTIFEYLRMRADEFGDTFIVSTHETGRFGSYSDQVWALSGGRVIRNASTETFLQDGGSRDLWESYKHLVSSTGESVD